MAEGAETGAGKSWEEGPDSYTPPFMIFLHRLQFRLAALVALCVLPLAVMLTAGHFRARSAAVAAAGREVGSLARIAARNQEQDFARAQQFLDTIAGNALLRGGAAAEQSAWFRDLVARTPGFVDLHLLGPDGTVLASALPGEAAAALCDREALEKSVRTGLSAVGSFHAVGEQGPTVNVLRPLEKREGEPDLVLGATVGLGWLSRFQSALDLPGDSVLELLDPEGRILLRLPDAGPRALAGEHPAPSYLRSLPLGEDLPVLVPDSDGVRKFFGLCPLVTGGTKQGFNVAIGIPESIVTEPLDRALRIHLVLTAALLLVCLGVARVLGERWVLRRVQGLVLATRRLASTDLAELKARVRVCQDPSELGDLERSFDDMARSLEKRAAELDARAKDLEKRGR
jgi:hypothetical protein